MKIDTNALIMAQILGGGGSSVTVEPLPVTANGTYTAPTGKAYSPVTVNVAKPDYLISDGDSVSTFYFNTAYALGTWLATLTYSDLDPDTGLYVCYTGLGYFFAVDLTSGQYALVWNDGVNIVPIYSTIAVPAFGVTEAGWQMASYAPSVATTVVEEQIIPALWEVIDNVIAKNGIAFGAKAHTFALPTITTSYTYTGSSQTVAIDGYSGDFMTKSGTASATSAGNYSVTVSLKDTVNCQWSDGSVTAKTLSWSIAKAALPKPTISKNTIDLTPSKTSDTFTVSRSGDGSVIATSSVPAKLSATVSGTTVTVTAVDTTSPVSATITVTVAEGTNYLAYTDSDVACSATFENEIVTTLYITTTAANVTATFYLGLDPSEVPSTSQVQPVEVNWGDGTVTQPSSTNYGTARTVTPNHKYTAAGNYEVTFKPLDGKHYSIGGCDSYNSSYSLYGSKAIIADSVTNVKLTKFVGGKEIIDIQQITVSGNTQKLGAGFRQLQYIEEVELSNGVVNFNYNRFFGYCPKLTKVTLPSTVQSLPDECFYGDPLLNTLICKATTPPTLGSSVFGGSTPADVAIYVPAGSVDAYKSATGWSDRAAYIQAIPS